MAHQRLRRVVFWEPTESPHKADLFEELARECPQLEIICCADLPLLQERRDMGWQSKPAAGYRLLVGPSAAEIGALVREHAHESLHVFSGIRWVPSIVAALREVRRARVRFAVMSEPRVAEGPRGLLRYLQSWLTEGWIRRRVECVLAIGRNGPPWFRSVGYAEHKLVPFAYFVHAPTVAPLSESMRVNNGQMPVRMGYLGRLLPMKGVFDVLAAAADLPLAEPVRFAGDGPSRHLLENAAQRGNIPAEFLGTLPLTQVGNYLRGLDVLVLASTSTDDGWGVVVSEALMVGTAVVATDCVGASVVLDDPLLGRVVPKRSPQAIAMAVEEMHRAGLYGEASRQQRARRARHMLSAQAGAQHLARVLAWVEGGNAQCKPAPFHVMTPMSDALCSTDCGDHAKL